MTPDTTITTDATGTGLNGGFVRLSRPYYPSGPLPPQPLERSLHWTSSPDFLQSYDLILSPPTTVVKERFLKLPTSELRIFLWESLRRVYVPATCQLILHVSSATRIIHKSVPLPFAGRCHLSVSKNLASRKRSQAAVKPLARRLLLPDGGVGTQEHEPRPRPSVSRNQ
ncbi:hypothetical protein E2C01_012377 [Portunus trituberculatus]|uniref:Uncharacterized protein n=1 Tax=Portunus trituberculatus TaxID=210409 RepID=A0A5B7DDW7_PORTR|nr:hypothetical protein [Portunus trituberculatus]